MSRRLERGTAGGHPRTHDAAESRGASSPASQRRTALSVAVAVAATVLACYRVAGLTCEVVSIEGPYDQQEVRQCISS